MIVFERLLAGIEGNFLENSSCSRMIYCNADCLSFLDLIGLFDREAQMVER